MLIFVNPGSKDPEANNLEKNLFTELPAAEIEVHNEWQSFINRLIMRLYDIDLTAIFISDPQSLQLLEPLKKELQGLNVVFLVSSEMEIENDDFYKFFPRVVFRIQDQEAILTFIKTKICFLCNRGNGVNCLNQ